MANCITEQGKWTGEWWNNGLDCLYRSEAEGGPTVILIVTDTTFTFVVVVNMSSMFVQLLHILLCVFYIMLNM